MGIYDIRSFAETVKGNSYVGRGIVAGLSADGKKAVTAYFIMGRSTNSRNRVFDETEDGIIIHAFDPAKLEDPSLVIYSPVRCIKDNMIVTNGDQTDTVYDFMEAYYGNASADPAAEAFLFEAALNTRCFEPDAPNFTPRISAVLNFGGSGYTYKMNICKSADPKGSACNRYTYSYAPLAGLGHFIHTYNHDGNPIPTFTGEPERVAIPNDIDEFTNEIWNSLDADNKVSLYVCTRDLASGKKETRIINKNRP